MLPISWFQDSPVSNFVFILLSDIDIFSITKIVGVILITTPVLLFLLLYSRTPFVRNEMGKGECSCYL